MASPKFCWFNGELIAPRTAKPLMRSGQHPKDSFRCPECNEPLRAAVGDKIVDHFEHWERTPDCSLSTLAKGQTHTPAAKHRADPVHSATEGRKQEVTVQVGSRNRFLTRQKLEQGNYTCAACGFRLAFENQFVIECHHTNPINEGETVNTLEDLELLCPTCHTIAHLRKDQPMAVEEIRKVRDMATYEPR
jgi:ssDNA-binding Zn-finger/Zn-ribbon topoisomerase 1